MKRIFYILEGNHGATYILNTKNTEAIFTSLKFYKARTLKQKIMKSVLGIYLKCLGLLCKAFGFCKLRDKHEINLYLEKLVDQSIGFEVDENSSVLISSTRDKVIIHHHGQYFHKFAFGNSYKKVNNEAKIYALLDKPLQYFNVSKSYDIEDVENGFCSFKLSSNSNNNANTDIDIVLALVELFNISRQSEYQFFTYIGDLQSRYLKSGAVCNSIEKVLKKLERVYPDNVIALGLVHRDFKPWNMNDESGLLIYDFEEAITNGVPLEDLLNYYIDPVVRYLSPVKVAETIFDDARIKEYNRYLEKLEIDLDFQVLLYCYLIERVIFWMNAKDEKTSQKYCELLQYIEMRENQK